MRELKTTKELKRFTREYEGILLEKAAAGDSEAMERIRAQYWPLVLRAAHQQHLATVREDAEGVAALSLVEAVHSYDRTSDVPFAAYAKVKLFGDMRTFFRRERAKWEREFVPIDTEEGNSFWEQFPEPEGKLDEMELGSDLEKALSELAPEEREVVVECLIYGRKTQKELALRDGVSFQCITRRRRRAVRKLDGLRRMLRGEQWEPLRSQRDD